jgi:hypothetical protein
MPPSVATWWILERVEVTFQGKTEKKRRIEISWQIDVNMENGKPYLVRRRYNCSLNEKATLRRDLESWRGRAFTRQELQVFDLENLLSVGGLLNLIHEVRNGSTYANVAGVMKLPKDMTAPRVRDYVRVCDRPPAKAGAAIDGPEITDDAPPFRIRMKDLTLYTIDSQLEELIEYRQSRMEDPTPATEEALAALDDETQRYMGALTRKIDGVAGLLLRWKEQRETIAAERARLKTLSIRIEAQDARLRDYVSMVMSGQPEPARGPRRLRGNISELVLRSSGGPAPLVVAQPELVPHELQTVEVTLRYDLWEQLVRGASAELADRLRTDARQKVTPANTLIRQELEKSCPACGGAGCAEYGGTGAKSVPGAYLSKRGYWIEVR